MSDSTSKKPLIERVRDAVDEVVGKLAEFLAPEPKLIPVRVRRPAPPRRRRRH